MTELPAPEVFSGPGSLTRGSEAKAKEVVVPSPRDQWAQRPAPSFPLCWALCIIRGGHHGWEQSSTSVITARKEAEAGGSQV